MIRTIITADNNFLTLNIPDTYVGKKIEVIAFTIDELVKQPKRISAKDVFKSLKLDTRGYKFDRDEANSR